LNYSTFSKSYIEGVGLREGKANLIFGNEAEGRNEQKLIPLPYSSFTAVFEMLRSQAHFAFQK